MTLEELQSQAREAIEDCSIAHHEWYCLRSDVLDREHEVAVAYSNNSWASIGLKGPLKTDTAEDYRLQVELDSAILAEREGRAVYDAHRVLMTRAVSAYLQAKDAAK